MQLYCEIDLDNLVMLADFIHKKDDSALIRWALCGPELARMIEEFEEEYDHSDESSVKQHHEAVKHF